MSFSVVVSLATAAALILASAIDAERIASPRMCRNTKCELYDLDISPCREALLPKPKPCVIHQGTNASITFKYKTSFTPAKPVTRLFAETLLVDMPFMDMDTNACSYTQCPIVANQTGSWAYTLLIKPSYPVGSYLVKLKFWDHETNRIENHECCFHFDLTIAAEKKDKKEEKKEKK